MIDTHEYTILVVEDEGPLNRAIRAKLERNGFEVVVAVDVDQALSYLEDPDVSVDAIWLDHYLFGNKDGFDFLSQAKEKGFLEDIPVFVVTNTGGHDKKETYMQLGALEYYVKSNHRLDEIVDDIRAKLNSFTEKKSDA